MVYRYPHCRSKKINNDRKPYSPSLTWTAWVALQNDIAQLIVRAPDFWGTALRMAMITDSVITDYVNP